MTPGAALTEGYLVNDRFQLLRLLGRGGMGSVWIARHLSLNIDVAIKFIDGALGGRDDLRSRFAQEARTAARIQSPYVVNILDYGFDGARPFIAMELLQGEPLGARLERERRLSPADVSTILAQAAKGLARAHSLGIVHRDLKPDNLFLCRDEEGGVHVKILDFGIARDDTPLTTGPSHRTGTGQLLGTPAYMSPEQALGRSQIDFRSDLYSLAVVAYHCLTGRLPFDTEALGELIVSISIQDPPLPSSFVPGLSPGIDSWFKCAFQKDPAGRFGSAKELADTFALASRGSSPAFDRTVLAPDGGATARDLGRFSNPGPTQPSPGVFPAGAPARTAPWSMAATAAPRDRASGPGGAVSGPPPTAPWSGAGGGAPAPLRVPDTFNGQSATQGGDLPRPAPRGPSPVLLGLVGLIVFALTVGGALVFAGHRGAVAVGLGPAVRSTEAAAAPSVTVAPLDPPLTPAPPAPFAAASVSASAGASPPSARPSPLPPAPRRTPPPPARSPGPAAATPSAAPRPARTNDYGL